MHRLPWVVGLGVLFALIWRLASRRHSLPCPVWLRWLVELDNPFARENRAAVITEHLALEPGMAVLDVGCGPGRLTVAVAREVGEQGRVVAVDVQAGMLARAREKARGAGLSNIEFIHARVGEARLGRGEFDRALLVTVLGEVPNREAALREIGDALKPGGVLSVTETVFDPHYQTRGTVTRLAEAAGLLETAVYGNRAAYTMHLQRPIR